MNKLTLEDIRECNSLTKEQMADIMGITNDKYDYIKENPEYLSCESATKISIGLDIGLRYMKIAGL